MTHFYEHKAEGADHLVITLPFPSTHYVSQRGLWRTDTNHDITKVSNRLSEQSAAAVLVGISHSTNLVGLPTTAFGGFIYYLHRAVQRLSGTTMYRTHFSKPLPWRGRAVDKSLSVGPGTSGTSHFPEIFPRDTNQQHKTLHPKPSLTWPHSNT